MNTEVLEKKVISADTIRIQPYVDATVENMGLEKYGLVVHEGSTHKEWLTCIETNGVKRFITGLDEFAPEVEHMKDKELKDAKIKDIRRRVIFLERALAANDKLKENDKDFWEKVKVIRRDNYEFWQDISIEVGNQVRYLNEQDPADLILLSCLEARGFGCVAPSFEDARSGSVAYKWYLDKRSETAQAKTSFKLIKNQALALLHQLYENNPQKLWFVAKCIDGGSAQYKTNTPPAVIYDNMDNYINGFGADKVVSKAAKMFIETAEMDDSSLEVKAVVKDAAFYRFIVDRPDGNLYHVASNERLGKSVADCIQYFKNPMYADNWKRVVAEVKAHW